MVRPKKTNIAKRASQKISRMVSQKVSQKRSVLFYFGSYKHPFYDDLARVPLADFAYAASRTEEKNAHIKPRQSQFGAYVKQTLLLRIIKFLGIPKIAPLAPKEEFIHSAQYLLRTPKRYVVDFEDISALTWFDSDVLTKPLAKYLLVKSFLSPNCVGILPWTNAAKQSLVNSIKLPQEILRKIYVIYPACAVQPAVSREKRSDVTLLFVGKLFYQKGGLDTIEAFVRLKKIHSNLRLIVVSQIPPEVKQKYTRVVGLEMYSNVDESLLQKLFARADIFVMPGHYDTFGFVYLQAMAYGLPCIGTDNFATPEIVTHCQTGLIIRNTHSRFDSQFRPVINFVDDAVNAAYIEKLKILDEKYLTTLVDAIEELVVNKKKRLLYGNNARTEIASGKFSMAARAKAINAVYSAAFR